MAARYPQAGWQSRLVVIQQLTSRAEAADVGHAGTDEHSLVDLPRPARQTARRASSGIVRRNEYWLFDIRQDRSITAAYSASASVSPAQLRSASHFSMPRIRRSSVRFVAVAFGNHPLQQDDVGGQAFNDGSCSAYGTTRSVNARQKLSVSFKRLLNFQIRQTFDFRGCAREDVLPFFLNGQQALFDGVQ